MWWISLRKHTNYSNSKNINFEFAVPDVILININDLRRTWNNGVLSYRTVSFHDNGWNQVTEIV